MLAAAALFPTAALLVRVRASSRRAVRALTDLRFDLTVSDIERETAALVAKFNAVDDGVAAALADPTFEAAIAPLMAVEAETGPLISSCTFVSHVAADARLRDAGVAAEQVLSEASVARDTRADVYRVVKAFADSPERYGALDAVQQRFVDRVIRDFERNGVHLDAEVAAQVKANKERMAAAAIEFHSNTNEENTELLFAAEELAGLPAAFVEGLERGEGGKLKLTLKYPHVIPVMDQCSVPATRKAVEYAFNRRCVEANVPLMEELARLRHETAVLMGHATHADYVLDVRMAKTGAAVMEFLEDLNAQLEPLARAELAELEALKTAEEGADSGGINMWDFRYYLRQNKEAKYDIDMEQIKAHFPVGVAVQGMLDLYQELLGLVFEEVANPHVWHPEVRMFRVTDASSGSGSGSGSGELLGHFYLDLFPRPGKFGHAAVFPVQARTRMPDGSLRLPACAMVCNFSKTTLPHSDVVTLLHEFGHAMHGICTTSEVARFSGTSVERDFVEAPSQMLENWCFEPAALARLSQPALPEPLARKLAATKVAHAGLLTRRQLLFGLLDQTIHTQPDADIEATLDRLHRDVMLVPRTPGTNMVGAFGHLAGGYDASYYGYAWSDVFAADMFSQFQAEGIFNQATGQRYRQCILAPGGTVDADQMLRNFLGREPSKAAFLKQLVPKDRGAKRKGLRRDVSASAGRTLALPNTGIGQHFLKNPMIVQGICDRAELRPTDVVLEIGPGTGNLTMRLLERAKRVVAVEFDPRMVAETQKRASGTELERKLQIVQGDALRVEWPYCDVCVANVPYQISSPLVFKLLAHRPHLRCAVLLLQEEFAQRLSARPGQELYCRLSVNTQLLARVTQLMRVGRNNFRPPPRVESRVVKIEPRNPAPEVDFVEFDGLTRLCFNRKNKSLSAIFGTKAVRDLLQRNYVTHCALRGEPVPDPLPDMREVVRGVLAETDMASSRSAKLDIDDFLTLLAAFNGAGVHFS